MAAAGEGLRIATPPWPGDFPCHSGMRSLGSSSLYFCPGPFSSPYLSWNAGGYLTGGVIAVIGFLIAAVLASSIKVANQWERVVVLRLGRFDRLAGPGLFFIIPILDMVAYRIDIRVITSTFKAENTLTRDTVPVDVDAVLFWKVVDPKMAALDVADYVSAINWASQTALRDVIGKTMLADMLEGRDKMSADLQRIIDMRTEPWGVNVISVEVKDVLIPAALQDAMSMQAQAERERQARAGSWAILSGRWRRNSARPP